MLNKYIFMEQKQTFYFYMDDSGTRSLNKNNFIRKDKMDYFALGGILVKEEDKEIVKNKYIEFCNKWDIKDPLHSTKIRGEREEYGWLKQNKTKRALFLNDLNSLLINIPVIGFAAVIDRKGYVDRYKQKYKEKLWPIDKTVYCILVERIIKYIKPLKGIIEIRFEETGKKEDRSILQYTEDLKKHGTPFDKTISSKKYNRLKNIDFKSSVSMRIKRKKKTNLFVQIADLYLYPMAKSGYDSKYKAWVNLFKNKKVINALVSIKTRSKLGIKYSCFDKEKDPE